MNRLAEIGALNPLDRLHRRDALWQAQRAVLPRRPAARTAGRDGRASPLAPMNTEERLWADYPRHRHDRRQPSHGAPPRGDERAGRDAAPSTWSASATAASCASPAR